MLLSLGGRAASHGLLKTPSGQSLDVGKHGEYAEGLYDSMHISICICTYM